MKPASCTLAESVTCSTNPLTSLRQRTKPALPVRDAIRLFERDSMAAPGITQLEMSDQDIEYAERMAAHMGYEQFVYTSSSALWGVFCLKENPRTWRGSLTALQNGCIIKTAEFGFVFIQDVEDVGFAE